MSSCDDPHAPCPCGAVVCLGEDPAAVDDAGDVTCPDCRAEVPA